LGCGLAYYTTLKGDSIQLPGGSVVSSVNARYAIAATIVVGLLCLAGTLIMALLAISISGVLGHAAFHVGKMYEDLNDDDDEDGIGGLA